MTPEQLKQYYQQLYIKHGDAPAAVQHVSRHAQNVRFKIFQEFIGEQCSIVDLGCGLGDFLTYLRQHNFSGKYLGCDFVSEFIVNNNNKFSQDIKSQFMTLNIISDPVPSGYDYVTMSGIFNNKLNCNEEFLLKTIGKAFKVAKEGVIFNALSCYVDYHDKELFYVDPLNLFEYIKRNITPFVLLKHDYVTKEGGFPYEFTMVLKKEGGLK